MPARLTRRGIGAIEPCLPSPAKELPPGPGWIRATGQLPLYGETGCEERPIYNPQGQRSYAPLCLIEMAVASLSVRSCLIDDRWRSELGALMVPERRRCRHHRPSRTAGAFHPEGRKRLAVTHPRWEPRAGIPLARLCAGGGRYDFRRERPNRAALLPDVTGPSC